MTVAVPGLTVKVRDRAQTSKVKVKGRMRDRSEFDSHRA